MEDRRSGEDRRNTECPLCPTTQKEIQSIRERLNTGGDKMVTTMKEIKKNRKFDIAILLVSVLSFIFNILLGGG